ncbi:MAG: Amylo-alpha6-glucosidase [Rhodocyclaceae bacterium]|nr:Amylo-alpha6-glucosidase [Rhodocyclaceae bacterium]
MEDTIRIAEQWYVAATSSRTDDRTRVLKHGPTFAVFDRFGDIHRIGTGEQGIYHDGTRFLSRLELRINGRRPMLLNSSIKRDNSLLTVDLTTPDLPAGEHIAVRKGTVHLFRAKLLWRSGLREHLRVVNYDDEPVALQLSVEFAADFADIFEVRGIHRDKRGRDLAPEIQHDHVVLAYEGLDGVTRRTVVGGTPAPDHITEDRIEYEINLKPMEQSDLHIMVDCESDAAEAKFVNYAGALNRATSALRTIRERGCTVRTSNDQFNDWLTRSAADLAMLTTGNLEGAYPYAGVPWYSCPFGRDGILTALAYLWVDPSMARSVLGYLAEFQAGAEDTERDAEPGKILHETRKGELAALGEIPFGRYYGSIDSTPLFIILAGAYYQRTGDLAFIQNLWPHVQRGIDWIDRYGDRDGDGFVEYFRRSSTGLVNQGWKDSHDAVFHRDGSLAEGSVALAEVQGYVYLARLQAADLAQALGDPNQAASLRRQAHELRERFEHAFWCEEIGAYALALDGHKQQCQVVSSNAGQVLWSGIASAQHARQTADTLLSPASFSGWGIRTIADGEARYNPMSYHNGSIWPHDNALIAVGLARYGMKDKTLPILGALFQASLFMDLHRLPELYCGFVRREGEGPTLYPVACSPQAWAAASAFSALQACLGLSFHSEEPRIRFDHPILPSFLGRVEISNLQAGSAVVDLVLERHAHDVGVNVLHKKGEIDVSVML